MTPIKTSSKASVGGAAVVMGKPDLGYRPADMNAVFMFHCDGLDGGTFDVLYYPAGGPDAAIEHVAGSTETDSVKMDGPTAEAFRVEFAGLGGGAAPVVHVNGQTRV
jgi:hypothetical protein